MVNLGDIIIQGYLKGDYANAKIMVSNLDELLVLVRETCEMEIDT